MRGLRFVAALAGIACAQPCVAASEDIPSGQLWNGTLGERTITACFDAQHRGNGVYYDTVRLVPIRLQQADDTAPLVLNEIEGFDERTGATWTFAAMRDDRRDGEWRQGDQTLPIRLTAVRTALPENAAPEYAAPCETNAFLAPLLAGGETTTAREQFDGIEYTELNYEGPKRRGFEDYTVSAFMLDPVRPGDAAINRALARVLPDGTAGHPMGQCVGANITGAGGLGYLDEFLGPIFIAPQWLSVRRAGNGYCGGAHPNNFYELRVYDRDRGTQVDPALWFGPEALIFYDDPTPGPGEIKRPIAGLSQALMEAVLANWPPYGTEPECIDAARSGTGWQIGLTREGAMFVPHFPHAMFACTEEIVLPWDKAGPFLSAEGRAVMAGLR